MTFVEFLVFLLVAGLAGAAGQALAGYSLGGCFVSIVVGFIGALLGTWFADALDLPLFWVLNFDGHPFPVVWAVLGGALFAVLVGLVQRSLWTSRHRV